MSKAIKIDLWVILHGTNFIDIVEDSKFRSFDYLWDKTRYEIIFVNDHRAVYEDIKQDKIYNANLFTFSKINE